MPLAPVVGHQAARESSTHQRPCQIPPRGAGPAARVSSLSSPWRATALVGLDRRARNRAVGTEYATVASEWLKPHPAATQASVGIVSMDRSPHNGQVSVEPHQRPSWSRALVAATEGSTGPTPVVVTGAGIAIVETFDVRCP